MACEDERKLVRTLMERADDLAEFAERPEAAAVLEALKAWAAEVLPEEIYPPDADEGFSLEEPKL